VERASLLAVFITHQNGLPGVRCVVIIAILASNDNPRSGFENLASINIRRRLKLSKKTDLSISAASI